MNPGGLIAPAGELHPIDPLRPLQAGIYRDELVEVRAAGAVRGHRSLGEVRTPHFDVSTRGELISVRHLVAADEIDDDLAGLLAEELFVPGWLRGPEVFERIFTGVVLTSTADPLSSWELFYRNTLARIDGAVTGPDEPAYTETSSVTERSPVTEMPAAPIGCGGGHGTVADYAPVYAHTAELLKPGSVLELGCCFGFLSLRLAAEGRQVVATDVSAGTIALLGAVAPRLATPLTVRAADATSVPAPDKCVDTVVAVHLLEHLTAEDGERVVEQAIRLARSQVLIAVPLEDEPNETWGHVRTVDLDDLRALGRGTGARYEVHEHHGGWLVLDLAG